MSESPAKSKTTPLRLGKTQRLFSLLLLVFLLRGLAIQCVSPPLEGPDEYQHLAYLQYLIENKKLPVYGKANVPKSMYPDLVANPHPVHGWNQTKRIGTKPYAQFFESSLRIETDPDIALYQSQHPPLYYFLVLPLYKYLVSNTGFQETVYCLRILNIAFAAISLLFLLAPLRTLMCNSRLLYAVTATTVFLSPIYLTFVSRVANDSLALLFGGAAIWMLSIQWAGTKKVHQAFLAGAFAGLGLMTKLTVLPVLPAGIVFMVSCDVHKNQFWANTLKSTSVFLASSLLVSAPFWIWSYTTYGVLFPSQETILNQTNSPNMVDLLKTALSLSTENFVFAIKFVAGTLWTSGWSFLLPKTGFLLIYAMLILAGLIGAGQSIRRVGLSRAVRFLLPRPELLLCLVLILSSSFLIYMHALQAQLAYGNIPTPAYYILIAYPACIMCLAIGVKGLGPKTATIAMCMLAGLFVGVEFHSLLNVAIPHWTGGVYWSEALSRLTLVHPSFLAPPYFLPLYAVSTGVLVLAVLLEHPGRLWADI